MGLINQISVLFLLIITGFVIRKKNIVSESFQKELSTLVLHVTLPAFIISSMNFTFSEDVLKDIGMILVISFATYIIALLLSYPITKLLGVSGKKRDIYQYLCIFANVGFMGYPVLELIAGKQAVFYGAIYNLPFNLFVWTIGISIMMRHKNEEEKVEIEVEEEISTEEIASNENAEEEGIEEEVEVVDEVETLKLKVAELEDQYLRVNAEFENMRKRLEKEKMSAVAYSNELFARDMLSIIDALDSASALKESEDIKSEELFEKVKEGIDLTVDQFKKSFEKHGIELVDISGEFDPNFHEAVMQVESEEKNSGEILQVFQKGYKIKDRLLRPAMVSIVK